MSPEEKVLVVYLALLALVGAIFWVAHRMDKKENSKCCGISH